MLKAVRTILIILLNIIFYGLVAVGGVQLCQTGYSFAGEVLGDTSAQLPPGEEKSVTIESSQDAFAAAEKLAKQNLIKNRYSFYLRYLLEKKENTELLPGTYTLNTSMTYEEILQRICGS